jgi:integrase
MAGSIRQRPDKGADAFELRVFLGRDRQGRLRHRSLLFHGTRRAAERELARIVTEQTSDPSPALGSAEHLWGPTTTINDAIAGWRVNGWADLSPATARRYEGLWKVHIRDTIGPRRIATLSPFDVEQYFRQMKASGCGRETIRYVRSVLNRACRLARKWSGNQFSNPIADTELPVFPMEDRSKAVRSPALDEMQALLLAAQSLDARFAACLRLIAATGMRRGEACALRWSNIDWESSVVTIHESIVAAEGGALSKSPKTQASIRQIAIDHRCVEILRGLLDEQSKLATAFGLQLASDAFAFSTEPGGKRPPHPDTVSKSFSKARALAGVASDVHLHSLRHFQATALDAVVSEAQKQARLGWATVHMARHYTGVVGAEDRRAAEYIGMLLEEADDRPTQLEQTSASEWGSPPSR